MKLELLDDGGLVDKDVHDRAGVHLIAAPHLFGVHRPAHARAPLENGNIVARFGEIAGADQGIVPRAHDSNLRFLQWRLMNLWKGEYRPRVIILLLVPEAITQVTACAVRQQRYHHSTR